MSPFSDAEQKRRYNAEWYAATCRDTNRLSPAMRAGLTVLVREGRLDAGDPRVSVSTGFALVARDRARFDVREQAFYPVER